MRFEKSPNFNYERGTAFIKDIVEIRWHGRVGQGAKTASLLLADAAFNTGKYVQGLSEYGPERMGAPIKAYNRISSERSTVHANIYFPDFVVVDETLLASVDVTAGLKETGAIVVNSSKAPAELRPELKGYKGKVYTIDAGVVVNNKVPKMAEKKGQPKAATILSIVVQLQIFAAGNERRVISDIQSDVGADVFVQRWQCHSYLLISNWLNYYVYQSMRYDPVEGNILYNIYELSITPYHFHVLDAKTVGW